MSNKTTQTKIKLVPVSDETDRILKTEAIARNMNYKDFLAEILLSAAQRVQKAAKNGQAI
jgi:hypothetical protein